MIVRSEKEKHNTAVGERCCIQNILPVLNFKGIRRNYETKKR